MFVGSCFLSLKLQAVKKKSTGKIKPSIKMESCKVSVPAYHAAAAVG